MHHSDCDLVKWFDDSDIHGRRSSGGDPRIDSYLVDSLQPDVGSSSGVGTVVSTAIFEGDLFSKAVAWDNAGVATDLTKILLGGASSVGLSARSTEHATLVTPCQAASLNGSPPRAAATPSTRTAARL